MQHSFKYNNIEARLCGTNLLTLQEAMPYTVGIFQYAEGANTDHNWAIAYFVRDDVARDWNLTFIMERPFSAGEDFMFVAKEGYDFLMAYEKVNGWLS